ncbi:RNA-binding transcriptional accessory protein [Eubacteriales bacterium OttesenSCG-928-A19]|nr:RNA-binding transcriptional accessory protein [Eubacteriales bacterium OttesenSCG-928-A19]
MDIIKTLAEAFQLRPQQVESVIKLIDEGNTIPFIARYRKEATGSLDDQVLRELDERLTYLRGLDKRREAIQSAMQELGVLTDELTEKLAAAGTLAELEDIYRPFKPKRRTRATMARERGLEPLAMVLMLQQPLTSSLEEVAAEYVDPEKEVPDAEAALAGARDILAEQFSDDAESRRKLRGLLSSQGVLETKGTTEEDSVYRLYYEFSEPIARIPGHRILAINRGEREEKLRVYLRIDDERALRVLRDDFVRGNGPCSKQVGMAADDAWDRLIFPSLERELRTELTDKANTSAVHVFADNLRHLLMQPPIKGRVTLGVDPGFRTGCKLAVIDANGKVLETGIGHFTLPGQERQAEQAKLIIQRMVEKHGVTAIAIGNGTASREAERFIAGLLPTLPEGVQYTIVSEAGASVYSASKLAAEEFPQFDVSLRSAVSIARRMQDPLAELVKIDPKAIGVGQYQHDLKEAQLTEALDGVVESCVNAVGVEVSTASPALLSHVAGIGPALAKNIVTYRDEEGIGSRAQLKKVPKLGPKAFEQCAGFLRVLGSRNPLDGTGVHPESYAAAEALLKTLGYEKKDIVDGNLGELASRAEAQGLPALAETLGIGLPTLKDIIRELMKPGRDPRDDLPPPLLRTDVLEMKDLSPGMELTGTVRNVVDFGAFVDIGVHQDGLVHISRMSNRFIKHPSEAAKVGDIVTVWVVEVDVQRKRIALTMKKDDA